MSRYCRSIIVSFFVWASLVPQGFAQDEFVVVSKIPGEGDFTSIQEALDSPTRLFDDIVVQPGIYLENPIITGNVILRAGEGPLLTVIDGSTNIDGRLDTVTVASNLANIQIIGFSITNGRHGVVVETSSLGAISNCVVEGNTGDGIRIRWDGISGPTAFEARNNVVKDNGQVGIALQQTRICFACNTTFLTTITGNVLVGNADFGIAFRSGSETTDRFIDGGELPFINYNNYFQNGTPYGPNVGLEQVIPVGTSETFESPRFLGNTSFIAFDARLSQAPASMLINTGPPDSGQRDPDGSRNDMGAFGGPGAASFFESVTDGPIVESILVTPPAVEQGQTMTIQAIVKVR